MFFRLLKCFDEKQYLLIMLKTTCISAQLTSLLTLSREELNLKTLAFLSRGLIVN